MKISIECSNPDCCKQLSADYKLDETNRQRQHYTITCPDCDKITAYIAQTVVEVETFDLLKPYDTNRIEL